MQSETWLGIVCICGLALAGLFCGMKAGLFSKWRAQCASLGVILFSAYVMLEVEAESCGELPGSGMLSVFKVLTIISVVLAFLMALFTEQTTMNKQEEQDKDKEICTAGQESCSTNDTPMKNT